MSLYYQSSHCGAKETNPQGWRFDPWPCSVGRGSGIAVNYGVGHRHSLDPMLLWLWCRLAAVAQIGPLAWELPRAAGVTLKKKKVGFYIRGYF